MLCEHQSAYDGTKFELGVKLLKATCSIFSRDEMLMVLISCRGEVSR